MRAANNRVLYLMRWVLTWTRPGIQWEMLEKFCVSVVTRGRLKYFIRLVRLWAAKKKRLLVVAQVHIVVQSTKTVDECNKRNQGQLLIDKDSRINKSNDICNSFLWIFSYIFIDWSLLSCLLSANPPQLLTHHWWTYWLPDWLTIGLSFPMKDKERGGVGV